MEGDPIEIIKEDPVEECFKSILIYVDITKYPRAEKMIRLLLESLFLCGEIKGAEKMSIILKK